MGTKLSAYVKGETVEITATITDKDNALANPSVSTVVRIADPDGTVQVESASMTNESTGKYFYAYDVATSAERGKWKAEVLTADGAGRDVSIGSVEFVINDRAIAPA